MNGRTVAVRFQALSAIVTNWAEPPGDRKDRRQQVEVIRCYMEKFRKEGNYFATAERLDWMRWHLHEAGLIQWRHGLGDPREAFTQAVAVSREALQILPELDTKNKHWKAFSFSAGRFLHWLLFGRDDADLRRADSRREEWSRRETASFGTPLDSTLLATMADGRPPVEWRELLSLYRHVGDGRRGLVAETWTNYMTLLEAARRNDTAAVRGCIERGEVLYAHRSNDPTFDAPCEGSGPANSDLVDYRLAAVLVAAERITGRSLECTETVHKWKW